MDYTPPPRQLLIFFAGVHGIGKTTACQQYWEIAGFHCVTASDIIKAEKGDVNDVKRVADVGANQHLLVKGISVLRHAWSHLLIDGHFAIINSLGKAEKIDIAVFKQLSPSVIVCLRDDPVAILQRLNRRDRQQSGIDVAALQEVEIEHAEWVAHQLAVPFICIRPDEMPEVVRLLSEGKTGAAQVYSHSISNPRIPAL